MNLAILRDDIRRMVDEVERRIASPDNRARQSMWDECGLPLAGERRRVPITVTPELQMWGRVHQISLRDFYQVPEVYVSFQLRTKLFAFDNFSDDRPIDRYIWMWFGTPFEGSLFDVPYRFYDDLEPEPFEERKYQTCAEAAEAIAQPDFRSSGMMPIVHRVYEGSLELLPDDYDLDFPDYIQTPLATACQLLGVDKLVMEAYDHPADFVRLLRRLMDIRVAYRQQRAEFLGTDLAAGTYDNDAVCTPILSPNLYRELVWPIEMELSERERGISYWHSCGNTTEMLPLIGKLPGIGLQHISAWTDRAVAAEVVRRDQALQVCVHPMSEVLQASSAQAEDSIRRILAVLGHHRIKIDADCIQACMPIPEQIERLRRWTEIAQRVTNQAGSEAAIEAR